MPVTPAAMRISATEVDHLKGARQRAEGRRLI
jgi:hypothetical protein